MEQNSTERRGHSRLKWNHPLMVTPVHDDGTAGEPILCKGKDISLTGIGFYLPHPLPTWQVSEGRQGVNGERRWACAADCRGGPPERGLVYRSQRGAARASGAA